MHLIPSGPSAHACVIPCGILSAQVRCKYTPHADPLDRIRVAWPSEPEPESQSAMPSAPADVGGTSAHAAIVKPQPQLVSAWLESAFGRPSQPAAWHQRPAAAAPPESPSAMSTDGFDGGSLHSQSSTSFDTVLPEIVQVCAPQDSQA